MYSDEKPLKQAIEEFLKAFKLNDKINQSRVREVWEAIVGQVIVKHTQNLFIKNKILFVQLDSAALREELSYAKTKLIKNINKKVGGEVIEDIVFK